MSHMARAGDRYGRALPAARPGASALAEWRHQRRARRKRLLVASVPAGGSCGAAGLGLARLAGHPLGRLGGPELLAAAVAGLVLAYALWPRGDQDRWARGAAGELATAEILGRLPARRWAVMHDLALPGTSANVDHLVIGPTGVWVVDSKAYRARARSRWGRVTVGSARLSTASVRWEAERVSDVLGARARPVVAVHGGGLPRRGLRCEGVRLVPARRLPKRLRRGRLLHPTLVPSEVRRLAQQAESRLARRASPS